jgi:hypothetical protein
MRRFVTVVALLFFTIPFGISITGCGKKAAALEYCNGGSTGLTTGQIVTISLQPKIYGLSVNQGEITSASNPGAVDCKGNTVAVSSYSWGTTDTSKTILDIQPSTGRLCGGTWNRNSGAGIADFTTCTVTGKSGLVYISATAGGASSNQLPVYVHPIATSVVLGPPSTNCATDPATNCSPASVNSAIASSAISGCPTSAGVATNPQDPITGCCAVAPSVVYASALTPVTPYNATGCLSQQTTGQLSARVYSGTEGNQTNISCLAGHLSYSPQTASVVTIDQNGVATAAQPGATIINAILSNNSLAGSSAGFFSTCPPADISLSYPGSPAGSTNIIVNPNNTQPITATVTDINGVALTGLALEYVSTTPIPIPASANGTVTPVYPGQASISAICQPPSCNNAPQSLIGVFGNGKPVISHALTVTTPGTNSTDLYIASTDSQYLVPVDFTQTQLGAPIRLPYAPNSMVISEDGTTIYLGSSTELMVVNSSNGALTRQDVTVRGVVLAVSPDNGTVVISDPVRKQVYLDTSTGTVTSIYGGVGTRAQWSPDSQTVYIAAGDQVLVYSRYSGWKAITPTTPAIDVAVTVPAVGAYFAGATTTARGYCPVTTTTTAGAPPTVANNFYPLTDTAAVATDRIAATNDGGHIIGANAATNSISDIQVNLATVPYFSSGTTANPVGTLAPSGGIDCPGFISTLNADQTAATGTAGPLTFTNVIANVPLTGITPTAITGVLPTSDSKVVFVTYTGTGGVLPAYLPPAFGPTGNTSGAPVAGTLTNIALSGSAIAPAGGAISADNSTAFIGTSGDDLVHIISIGSLTDTKTIAPALPSVSGGAGTLAVPNLLVEKPRPTT